MSFVLATRGVSADVHGCETCPENDGSDRVAIAHPESYLEIISVVRARSHVVVI